MNETDNKSRVYVPHWLVGLLIKIGIPLSMLASSSALGLMFDMWKTVNTLEQNHVRDEQRMVDLEEFMSKGPRVTTEDLDERASEIATIYAETIKNQTMTLNEVLVIQRQNTILINRIDERVSGQNQRIDRIESKP